MAGVSNETPPQQTRKSATTPLTVSQVTHKPSSLKGGAIHILVVQALCAHPSGGEEGEEQGRESVTRDAGIGIHEREGGSKTSLALTESAHQQ